MSTQRIETVKITYDGKTIVVHGKTFNISVEISTTSLTGLYLSGKGTAEAVFNDLLPPTQVFVEKETTEPAQTEPTPEQPIVKESAKPKPAPSPKRSKPKSKLIRHPGRNYDEDYT
jgi:hypothetical protein